MLQALYTYVERQGQTANARDNVFLSFTYSSRKVPFFILSLGSNYDLKSLIFFYSRLALITPGLQLHYKTYMFPVVEKVFHFFPSFLKMSKSSEINDRLKKSVVLKCVFKHIMNVNLAAEVNYILLNKE